MDMQKKKQLFLIGGVALAVLVAVVLLVIVLSGSGGGRKKYEQHYNAAEAAFLRRDYDKALSELEQAMEIDATEESYLLMADVYYAQGETERAIQVLYLGYSRAGGSGIKNMLDRLQSETDGTEPATGKITVGGVTFAPDTTAVVLSGKGLNNSDLKTLCGLKNLQNLSLSDNAITDVSPIAGLTELTSLQLSDNAISDVTALGTLSKLKTLYLDGNPVKDLTPLYRLSGLKTLSMKNVGVSPKDLASLEEALPNCSVFTDAGTEKVTKITLGGRSFFSDVTELSLGGLDLTDISALRQCRDLVKLDLRDNRIQDLTPLMDLGSLEELNLWNNSVSDLTPLAALTNLRYLDLDTNRVTDISPLEYITGLEELWLNNNSLTGFTSLKKLTGLTRLGLKNTGVTDAQLDALYGLRDLKELSLEENKGVTAAGYEALKAALPKCVVAHSELLWSVTLGGKTYTSDATEIKAPNSGVKDLSGLEHFTELTALELDDNEITDLSPLYGLSRLKTLSVRGNEGLTAEEVKALREKLPGCTVLADPEKPEASEPPETDPEREPGDEPGTTDADPSSVDVGASAAVAAAGSGSGYAILWCASDPASAGIREGFVERAGALGMNVVFDGSFPVDTEEFTIYLTAMRNSGADVVFLAAGDTALSLLLRQAEDMGYDAEIIQVY